MITHNRYDVPRDTWRRWKKVERAIFNKVYFAIKNKALRGLYFARAFDSVKVSRKDWAVTAYNIAWVAAEEARDFRKRR